MPYVEGSLMKENINDLSAYQLHSGINYKAYEYLGAHTERGGHVFRAWEPDADAVYLVGDFNGWDDSMPMKKISGGGVWEYSDLEKRIRCGELYKFKVVRNGESVFKGDPYAAALRAPDDSASVVLPESDYSWRDEGWLKYRKSRFLKSSPYSMPINVYEVELGSWKRRADGTCCTYFELASELSVYAKQMGYTHVALVSVAEHVREGDSDVDVCGRYAPSSRHGSPDGLRSFVDIMHEAGIGVIFEWSLPHIFGGDGVCEKEFESFWVSNAVWWIDQFHADGLLADFYEPESRLCDEEKAFFKKLNAHIKNNYPDVIIIAGETVSSRDVTGFENGGLGFDIRFNVGWRDDTFEYVNKDPIYRKYHHEKLTFPMTYAFGERYMLPVSRGDVCADKGSLLDKMSGASYAKIDEIKVFAAYMMTYPAKKLLFMGSEIGHLKEWSAEKPIEWSLLDRESHAKLQLYFSELNHLYLKNPALWQNDGDPVGFFWIDPENRDHSILSYRRVDRKGNSLTVVLNFTPVRRDGYLVGAAESGTYEEVFNSDDVRFGGVGAQNLGELKTAGKPWNRDPYSLKLTIPPMGAIILRRISKDAPTSKVRRS